MKAAHIGVKFTEIQKKQLEKVYAKLFEPGPTG